MFAGKSDTIATGATIPGPPKEYTHRKATVRKTESPEDIKEEMEERAYITNPPSYNLKPLGTTLLRRSLCCPVAT